MKGSTTVPDVLAESVWTECRLCGHWWLIPQWKAREPDRFVCTCCRH